MQELVCHTSRKPRLGLSRRQRGWLTRAIGVTAVVVTHDMTSAFRIGSRMIMLGTGPNQGKIIATGTPSGVAAGMKEPVWLEKGDVVEAYVEGVGTLRNTII